MSNHLHAQFQFDFWLEPQHFLWSISLNLIYLYFFYLLHLFHLAVSLLSSSFLQLCCSLLLASSLSRLVFTYYFLILFSLLLWCSGLGDTVWLAVVACLSSHHVLQPYLPDDKEIPYQLRARSHTMALINKTKFLNDADFIICLLYKHSYWSRLNCTSYYYHRPIILIIIRIIITAILHCYIISSSYDISDISACLLNSLFGCVCQPINLHRVAAWQWSHKLSTVCLTA